MILVPSAFQFIPVSSAFQKKEQEKKAEIQAFFLQWHLCSEGVLYKKTYNIYVLYKKHTIPSSKWLKHGLSIHYNWKGSSTNINSYDLQEWF